MTYMVIASSISDHVKAQVDCSESWPGCFIINVMFSAIRIADSGFAFGILLFDARSG